MFLLHFILPLAVFYFYRNRIMLWGLLLGNLIDLDHVYYRIIGKVDWFGSACARFGENCSIGFYPLHNFTFLFIFLIGGLFLFGRGRKMKFAGWLFIGAALNILLDYLHQVIGFGI